MDATFHSKTQLSSDVWQFCFTTQTPFDYLPGQYVDVSISGKGLNRQSRVFSLTSLPNATELSFAAKIPSPCSDYKQLLMSLQPGEPISLSQAMGDLVLPRDTQRPLVFVAGGLGIASFVSMLKNVAASGAPRDITLLYAARSQEDILFASAIAKCPGLNVEHFISPDRLSAQAILTHDKPGSLIYVSGSEPFTMGLRADLLAAGKSPNDVVYDFFDGYKPTDF